MSVCVLNKARCGVVFFSSAQSQSNFLLLPVPFLIKKSTSEFGKNVFLNERICNSQSHHSILLFYLKALLLAQSINTSHTSHKTATYTLLSLSEDYLGKKVLVNSCLRQMCTFVCTSIHTQNSIT